MNWKELSMSARVFSVDQEGEVKRVEERGGFGQRRGRFRGCRETGAFVPKSVEVGKECEADIQEVSRRGGGIARIEGLVIFVPNAKQGEHVKIKVTRISRRFAEAEVV